MNTYFRLYTDTKNDFNSTIFDLINGDKETKQTKGLAYIFSQYTEFLFLFLENKNVKDGIKNCLNKNLNIKTITSIEISAERITTNKKRADIVIKIEENKTPLIAIIIEAKSIKTNVNQQALSNQIFEYLDDLKFPELKNYRKLGLVLTKYKQSIPSVVNICWENIIQLLSDFCKKKNNNEIINQYLKFLTQIDKSMKYYEKEVLSIPASKTLSMVQKHNIYECPDTKDYNYKKPLFVTFRKGNGGEMNMLYKIEDIIILNPSNQNEIQTFENSNYSDSVKKRILEYINQANYQPTNDKRFYVLSESESIELPLKPKPLKNFQKFGYYSLKEILTNAIVKTE